MQSAEASPLVSIIIPVYNGSNYLRQAIDSALAQTYPAIEVIVVNDGSTDSGLTESICRSYGERITYFVKENGGVSSALNYGIEHMRGDFFSWLSHDDLYSPEKIQRQIKYLKEHPEMRIIGSGHAIVDARGKVVKNHINPADSIVRNGRDAMNVWIYGCALLIDRTVFADVGNFSCSNKTVQDLEMWLDIAFRGIRFCFMPEVLCQWRMHDESGSFAGQAAHFVEVDHFFRALPKKYSLAFFSANGQAATRQDRAEIYEWLGEQARHRGGVNSARIFFCFSWLNNLNVFRHESRRRLKKLLSYLIHSGKASGQ
jgi:glycosyltransferase involved in cell wall biosynthesis